MLYMGIDIGTQGARCVVSDERGQLAAAKSVPFEVLNVSDHPGWYEQSPEHWQRAAEAAIADCVAQLKSAGRGTDELAAISVDGTSGTVLALDRDHRPLTRGIMYNDSRARAQAGRAHAALADQERKLGYTVGASYSLPRLMWIRENLPEVYEKTAVFVHQADYIAGLLCGEYRVSDYSNALKTGYDLLDDRWPGKLSDLGLDVDRLPRIVRPGAPIAPVTREAASRLGLSPRTMVVGGSTDGYASALAAGAVKPGDWASIIGTTFVLKGVTRDLVIDPNGSSYSHRLPTGAWLLGGAGNIGGRVLNGCTGGRTFDELNAEAEALVPTGVRCYPLPGRGERFPFVDANCEAFYIGDITGGRLYPAVMEGVAFAERLSLERMAALGCAVGDVICTTGGACRSALWLRIRASLLNRQLRVPRVVDAAMGSALLAASGDMGGLDRAAQAMITYVRTVDPEPKWVAPYEEIYQRFLDDVKRIYGV